MIVEIRPDRTVLHPGKHQRIFWKGWYRVTVDLHTQRIADISRDCADQVRPIEQRVTKNRLHSTRHSKQAQLTRVGNAASFEKLR